MDIDLPGIYVDRIVKATEPKKIELLTIREDPSAVSDAPASKDPKAKTDAESAAETAKKDAQTRRVKIAKRAAKEMKDGDYCNLGVGMPVLAANYLPKGTNVWLQSENGILGMGPYPTKDQVDA
jgi:3-oxoacid CoA-transferase